MAQKRIRRSEEQLVADLEARIAALKAKAARKQAKADPAIRHTSAALKSIDKALEAAADNTVRKALQEARTTLTACLALDGVVPANGRTSARSAPVAPDTVLEHVRRNPGQRGEQIAAELGTDTKTLRPAMQKLIAAKKIKTKGQKRGMTYQLA